MNLVVAGHVDHGKSTVLGRLFADSGALPEGKLEQVKAYCARNARPFEYAYLLDALKDEQRQGITIEAARTFFKTKKRDYLIVDAPGHVEFIKNMVTGAARAEGALLVIDAAEGVRENSKRHGYLLGLLGIRQVVVVVNKMDLVRYDRGVFDATRAEFADFLRELDIEAAAYIPVSGRNGDNLVVGSTACAWYDGPTVLEKMDQLEKAKPPEALPFRMPLQDIYRFTEAGDDRRIFVGTVASGMAEVGQEIVFYPSGKRSRIGSIEGFNAPPAGKIGAAEAVGFTLSEQIYVRPGELVARADEKPPSVATRIRVNLFWMGRHPMLRERSYKLKLGAKSGAVELVEILNVLDASELSTVKTKQQIDRFDVADCVLELAKPLAFDAVSAIAQTGRFVVVDNYEIVGGGTVVGAADDRKSVFRERVARRNSEWQGGEVDRESRRFRNRHDGKFILLTGASGAELHALASALEKRLFTSGFSAYYIGMNGLLSFGGRGDNAEPEKREEQIVRLGEIGRMMSESGQLFLTTIGEIDEYDLAKLRLLNEPSELFVVGVGAHNREGTAVRLDGTEPHAVAVERIMAALNAEKIIADYCI